MIAMHSRNQDRQLNNMPWVCLLLQLWLGMLLNFLGALIRFFSTFHSSGAHGHFWLVISGQVVCALANPSGLYLPAKVADVWFPQERRAFANMISSMCESFVQSGGPVQLCIFLSGCHQEAKCLPDLCHYLCSL